MDSTKRLFELAKLLNEKIDAFAYYSGIGFQNALGDFEIDEDKWEENSELIKEFESLVEDISCDFLIIDFYPDPYIMYYGLLRTVSPGE